MRKGSMIKSQVLLAVRRRCFLNKLGGVQKKENRNEC